MSARAIVTLICIVLLAAIAGGAAWQQSRIDSAQQATRQAEARTKAVEAERDTARLERDAARNNVRVVTEYVDRVQTVHVTGKTITKEIPVYVTAKSDAACAVPVGFVRIHDAAAANQPPEPASGDTDAPAAGVALSVVADTVAGNYTQYHALAQQVTGLQDYITTSCPGAMP